MKTLLVIGGSRLIDWYSLFDGAKLHDTEEVKVDHAFWDDITLVSYSDSGLVITLAASDKPLPNTPQNKSRTVTPNFVLIRSASAGVYGQDYKNILVGLAHSRVPCINQVDSMYFCMEKPMVYGKLREVQRKAKDTEHGFPLISQAYFATWKGMTFVDQFPCVMKVGTAHSGFGKMRVNSSDELEDFRSVMALQGRYVTSEPFIKWDYDFRIQKIGPHYRAFRRYSTNWKGKGFSQTDEDIPVTPQYRKWIDLASEALGMEICALDGVHSPADDKQYIIELNDSAIGLIDRHKDQDLQHIKDLVLLRMEQAFPPSPASAGAATATATTAEEPKKKKSKKSKDEVTDEKPTKEESRASKKSKASKEEAKVDSKPTKEEPVSEKSKDDMIGVLQQRIKALELDKSKLEQQIAALSAKK